ncbi:MAG: hypothetical protein HOW73_05190 [Polyangiaceae bacterium]|nr:hypothetical protein [Polyangiaceae bacterium]
MKSIFASIGIVASLTMIACGDSAQSDDGEGGSGGTGGGESVACPVPTAGPTIHDSVIEEDEVWRAEDGPHIVDQWVTVRNGATLTIDPCATVQVAAGKGISVAYPTSPNTGMIVAEGDAEHPITFEGKDGARWGHILLAPGAKGSFAHATFDNGGSEDTAGATLVIRGDGTFPTKRDVFVEDVTIRRSKGAGVHIDNLAGFADGSNNLTITESGDETTPYPMYIDEHAIDTLPRGSYTGNLDDAIFVDPAFHLEEDVTMKNLGVPYVVGTFPADSLVIGAGFDSPVVTMTIEPGVHIEMHPGAAFEVEHYTGPEAASGVLIAEGTAEDPIVFTSAAATPAAGDWQGLAFGGIPSANNSLKHVRIEYTGADCGCIFVSCSAIDQYEGAVVFSQQPPSAFIQDSVIAHGSSHGVVLGYLGDRVDFKPGITFEDMGGCDQTLPSGESCPDPKPACE